MKWAVAFVLAGVIAVSQNIQLPKYNGDIISPRCIRIFYKYTDSETQGLVKSINLKRCQEYYKNEGEQIEVEGNKVTGKLIGKPFSYEYLGKTSDGKFYIRFYDQVFAFKYRGEELVDVQDVFVPCFKRADVVADTLVITTNVDQDGACTPEVETIIFEKGLWKHTTLEYEGFRSLLYRDPKGYKTIGFGHKLKPHEKFRKISKKKAIALFFKDMAHVERKLKKHIPEFDTFPPKVKFVLRDLGYNVGVYGVLKFEKMLESLKKGDYVTAAKELLNSKYSRDVGKRAIDNAKRILMAANS